MLEILVLVGIMYVLLDFSLGIGLKRCVLPGLKCRVCRESKNRR
jgi:hypothetical protein